MYLIVLELKNSKWFVCVNDELIDSNEMDFLDKCKILYEYVNQNEPININEMAPLKNVLEIDFVVKKYMKIYGVGNVRGGSYSSPVLPYFAEFTLNKELNVNVDNYKTDSYILRSAKKTYDDKFWLNRYNIEQEIERLNKEVCYNENVINKLQELRSKPNLNNTIFDDIEWFTDYIDDNKVCDDEDRYLKFIAKISDLLDLYNKQNDKNKDVEIYGLYLRNPRILFDLFFYYRNKIPATIQSFLFGTSWINQESKKLMKLIEHMAHVIINKFDEYQYDYHTFTDNFKREKEIYINYLNSNCRKIDQQFIDIV